MLRKTANWVALSLHVLGVMAVTACSSGDASSSGGGSGGADAGSMADTGLLDGDMDDSATDSATDAADASFPDGVVLTLDGISMKTTDPYPEIVGSWLDPTAAPFTNIVALIEPNTQVEGFEEQMRIGLTYRWSGNAASSTEPAGVQECQYTINNERTVTVETADGTFPNMNTVAEAPGDSGHCELSIETREDGSLVFRGSASGLLERNDDTLLPFVMTWNVVWTDRWSE
ncbi:MAG: hypothetical protein ACYC6C_13735 [Coriobacteriia bacterium]